VLTAFIYTYIYSLSGFIRISGASSTISITYLL
jgi:hypothetical protein